MDYTATATLAGPIDDVEADALVRGLRDYRASHRPSGHDGQLDVTFTLRAGSSRETVIRALSLSDDLGHRLVRLQVDPIEIGDGRR